MKDAKSLTRVEDTISLDATTTVTVRKFGHVVSEHREFTSAIVFFLIMLAGFAIANPQVWFNTQIYSAIATTFPQYAILAVGLVFVIVSGEIDLSFASVLTVSSFGFAKLVDLGAPVAIGMLVAIAIGIAAEGVSGLLVAYAGLPSFVVTLGMFYLWDGLVNVLADGNGIGVQQISDDGLVKAATGMLGPIPAQALWAVLISAICLVVYSRRRFGAHVMVVGDNSGAAESTGISVARVKLGSFLLLGACAGVVGILTTLVNSNFYPSAGDGLQLPALAAVFVGGTPLVGGVGTVAGAFVGALTVAFINTGIVTSGLSGFYTQFAFGIVIVLSIVLLRLRSPGRMRHLVYRSQQNSRRMKVKS
ncbi:MAG: ABC transporter permease [Microbacteriaceae bacterium]|nr:MAG: ABC transporter permease [Microbacteriaceae bacterium]